MALPFLILIIAGIAEVGILMIQRNRTALVARETTRFVASGGDDNDSLAVSIQTAQQSFGGQIIAFEPERVNIYIIHATVNDSGPSPGDAIIDDGDITVCASEDDFCETHIYPPPSYFTTCAPDCVPQKDHSGWTSGEIYNRLDGVDIADAELAGLKVVAAVVQYNTTTLIPLPIFGQTDGGVPLNEITIMRQEATISEAAGSPTQGCSAYPIFIAEGALGDSGHDIPNAVAGEVFNLTRGINPAANEFAFGLWNGTNLLPGNLPQRLADSLGYQQWFAGNPPIGNAKDTTPPGYNYINPDDDPNDQSLHKGDYVFLNTDDADPGTFADDMMQDHITDERVVRVFAFDDYDNTGFHVPYGAVRISQVALVKLTNYAGGASGTLDLEFVRLDSSCGN